MPLRVDQDTLDTLDTLDTMSAWTPGLLERVERDNSG